MNVAVQLANWWHMILARACFIFSPPPPPPPCLARVALSAKCRVRLAWLIKPLLFRLGSVVLFVKRELCFYALLYIGLEPKQWSIKRYLVLSLTLALICSCAMPSMATMSNWFATNNPPVRKSKPPSVRSFCSLTSLCFLSPSRILYITLFGDGATLAQKLFSEGLIWKLINRVVMNYLVGNRLEHFPMRLIIVQ